MGTVEAIWSVFTYSIQSGFQHYADFRGRASRPAYWWWALFYLLVNGALFVLREAVGTEEPVRRALQIGSTIILFSLFLPHLAVAVRRLHDSDRSGWWALIALIPFLGSLLLVVLLLKPGTPGNNRYGSPPAH